MALKRGDLEKLLNALDRVIEDLKNGAGFDEALYEIDLGADAERFRSGRGGRKARTRYRLSGISKALLRTHD